MPGGIVQSLYIFVQKTSVLQEGHFNFLKENIINNPYHTE